MLMYLEVIGFAVGFVGFIYVLSYVDDLIRTYRWMKKNGKL